MAIRSTSPALDVRKTITIGGDLVVNRLGYGAMHLTGPGMWGPPNDPENAIRVLRRAVELGVNFIDTADSYGPGDNERIIRQALSPYPDDLVITTKGGMLRSGPTDWTSRPPYVEPLGRPAYLRQQVEISLRNLGVDRIDLYQLHSIDPLIPLADQLGALVDLRDEGKIHHIGISGQPEVSIETINQAMQIYPDLAAVENLFNVADQAGEPALRYAEQAGLAFLPWFPLGHGELVGDEGPLRELAQDFGVTPSQLALAWLLHTSPATVVIPGTTNISHLEENVAASNMVLSSADQAAIISAVQKSGVRPWRPTPPDRHRTASLESDHPNVSLLRALYRDLETVADHCDADVVLHPATRSEAPVHGRDGVAAWEKNFTTAFQGTLQMDMDSVIANDHFGAVIGIIRGTLKGKKIAMPFCGLWRFRDGRLVEHWENAYDPSAFSR